MNRRVLVMPLRRKPLLAGMRSTGEVSTAKPTYVSFATSPGSNVGASSSTDSTRMFDDGGH